MTIAIDSDGRQRMWTDNAWQVRHAAALAAHIGSWLRDEEAGCTAESSRMCLSMRRLAAPLARRAPRSASEGTRCARRATTRDPPDQHSSLVTQTDTPPGRSFPGRSHLAGAKRHDQCILRVDHARGSAPDPGARRGSTPIRQTQPPPLTRRPRHRFDETRAGRPRPPSLTLTPWRMRT